MNMTMDALRAFVAAAETENFTKAAEKVYMTQPAFSRLMASLEKEWSTQLFERSTRHVALTAAGKTCYMAAVRILDQYDHMLHAVEEIRRTGGGEIRIGCNAHSGVPHAFVDAMRQLREAYPGVQISMLNAGSQDLIPMVERGELDCAVAWSKSVSSPQQIAMLRLEATHKYAVLPVSKQLTQRGTLGLRDLVGTPVIFLKTQETRTYQMVQHLCQELGIHLMEAEPARDLDEMLLRVSIGEEVGITSFAPSEAQTGSVVYRPIHDLDQEEINGWRVLVWRRDCEHAGVHFLRQILSGGETSTNGEPGQRTE